MVEIDADRADGAEPTDGADRADGAAPALRLHGVSVTRGGRLALDGIDLQVRRGERVALIGPSGAGKSPLLGLVNGTVAPTSGHLGVLGSDPTKLSSRDLRALRTRIGSVHQQLHLIDPLRVVHNVNAGRLGSWSTPKALWSLIRPVRVEDVREALERVGISQYLHQRTDRLSGGEQQRVALARLLVQDPDLVLADEPVSSLDPARAEEVMRMLGTVLGAGEGGPRTLIVSLHDVDLAVRHCERVIGLRHGRVVVDMPAADVDERTRQQLYDLSPDP